MSTSLRTTLGVIATTALLALAGCGSDDGDAGGDSTGVDSSTADFNDADVSYAQGMIIHHEQAIEMSDIILEAEGIEAEVTELAEQIKAAQGPEIEQMNAWLDTWGAEQADPHHDHVAHGHEGMLTDEQLTELGEASGFEAQTLFLEQMVEHHEGAVSMAQQHLEAGENPEALALSEQVIADQNAEIELMREILAG